MGCSCMGQQLVACYRTLKDEDTGLSFCMIMRWNGFGNVEFKVQKTDELMHLWFEDNGCDWERERELEQNGDIQLDQMVVESSMYQKVYQQLKDAITKKITEKGYTVNDDFSVVSSN